MSLRTALEEFALLVLPHGGQRTARRNAWRAAFDGRTNGRRSEAAGIPVPLSAPDAVDGPLPAAASR